MSNMVNAPLDMMESIAACRLPAGADRHIQRLMDRNNEGELTKEECEELAALIQWSEEISLLRARALHVLGRAPQ